ncbi:hypothetical protein C0J52_24716 [Blattella germanica]|nr:hypothetical protein C0J52_24716 [Blattella germanica]
MSGTLLKSMCFVRYLTQRCIAPFPLQSKQSTVLEFRLFVSIGIEEDKVIRRDFCIDMLRHNEDNVGFCERIVFSDGSTFHLSGKLNTQNVRI